MSLRDSFFAMTYDRQMGKTEEAGLRDMRKRLLADAKGRVLEIGSGTGANLPWYGPEVESLTMTGRAETIPPTTITRSRTSSSAATRAATLCRVISPQVVQFSPPSPGCTAGSV